MYQQLSADNPRTLPALTSSLFHLVLDDRTPADNAEQPALMLHGHGRGRWHDQSLSLVVCDNGVSGFSFEHTWGDGQTVLRWATDVYDDGVRAGGNVREEGGVADVEELEMVVAGAVQESIQVRACARVCACAAHPRPRPLAAR